MVVAVVVVFVYLSDSSPVSGSLVASNPAPVVSYPTASPRATVTPDPETSYKPQPASGIV